MPTPSAAEVLRQRALALAAVPEVMQQTATLEVICFYWGQELYALETRFVREAFPLREITPLPGTPGWVLGLVNVRSQVLAALDLRSFLNLPAPEPQPGQRLLILQDAAGQFGILVDAIDGVRYIAEAALTPATMMSTEVRTEYVQGVTEDRLVLLSGQSILEDKKLELNQTH